MPWFSSSQRWRPPLSWEEVGGGDGQRGRPQLHQLQQVTRSCWGQSVYREKESNRNPDSLERTCAESEVYQGLGQSSHDPGRGEGEAGQGEICQDLAGYSLYTELVESCACWQAGEGEVSGVESWGFEGSDCVRQ